MQCGKSAILQHFRLHIGKKALCELQHPLVNKKAGSGSFAKTSLTSLLFGRIFMQLTLLYDGGQGEVARWRLARHGGRFLYGKNLIEVDYLVANRVSCR